MPKITSEELQEQIKNLNTMVKGYTVDLNEAETDEEKDYWQGEIDKVQEQIKGMEADLQDLREKEENSKSGRNWVKTKDRIIQIIEHYDMGYIATKNPYIIYCKDTAENVSDADIVNPVFREIAGSGKSLSYWFKTAHKAIFGNVNISGFTDERLLDLFVELDRSYVAVTSTFRLDKWDAHFYNRSKILMEKYWVKPKNDDDYNSQYDFLCDIPELKDFIAPGNYDKRYGFWLYCLCSGKLENINHIKEFMWFKYSKPHLAAKTPNLDIAGAIGGTGKGGLVTVLKRIHTSSAVVSADIKEITGFAGRWQDALYVNVDEGNQEELREDDLKRITGDEEHTQKIKFEENQTVDRGFNLVFTTQREEGCVKLSGKGLASSDRRWSAIKSTYAMIDVAKKLLKLEEDDAAEFVDMIWDECLRCRESLSYFLGHLKDTVKLGNKLNPLHGEDYKSRFNKQKDELTKCFDKILPVLKDQGVMATDWIHRIAQTRTENKDRKHKNVLADFEKYLYDHGISYDIKKDTSILITDSSDSEEIRPSLMALRLTGDLEKKPYSFDWNLISPRNKEGKPLPYDKYRKVMEKESFGLDIYEDSNDTVDSDDQIRSTTQETLKALFSKKNSPVFDDLNKNHSH